MALISDIVAKLTAGVPPTTDTNDATTRGGPYGEVWTHTMLDDGDSHAISGARYQARATPAVAGTGIAMGIQTTFSDTANIPVVLVNGASANGKRVIMEYIKGRITAAGTSSTSAEAAIEIDSTNRYSSGGTALTPVSTTTEDNTATILSQCRVGSVTAAAAGANRKWLWSGLIRKAAAPLWIVNDTITFVFGAYDGEPDSTFVVSSTDAGGSHLCFRAPSAVIGPGGSLLLHLANIANASTSPSIEWEIGWKEY